MEKKGDAMHFQISIHVLISLASVWLEFETITASQKFPQQLS